MKYNEFKKVIYKDKRSTKLNYKVDGRIYYVYRITDIQNNKHYYGYRIQKKINIMDDLMSYSSSSKMKRYIQENKNEFKFKIVKMFNNSAEAIIFESYLHNYFDVKNNIQFFNESNQTPFGFDTTGKSPWNKGMNNIGGYKHSNKRSPMTDENKRKLSEKMLGHKKKSTVNYKNISKNKLVVIDKKTGKKIKIDRSDWDKEQYSTIGKNMLTAYDLKINKTRNVTINEYNTNRFLIANGSKWFYEYNKTTYRKNDLQLLMIKENINVSLQTFQKKLKKITLDEYIKSLF